MSQMIPITVKYPELIKEWDYEKNDISPEKVPCCTNQKYFWKCENGHSMYAIPKSQFSHVGKCPYCSGNKLCVGINDLWTTHPEIAKMLKNPDDGYKLTHGNKKKVDWICPMCGNLIKNKTPNQVMYRGLSCPRCSDGVSYPEKVFTSLMDYMNVEYIFQLSKLNNGFEWCDSYRYDFYLCDYNIIVETHGGFHYGIPFKHSNALSPDEVKNNDKNKMDLALNNGISKYICIDCRYSKFEYIKNSIINSELNEFLNFSEIDWEYVENNIVGSYMIEVCEYFNKHPDVTLSEIGEIFHKHPGTISTYLINGTKINLCQYIPTLHQKHLVNKNHFKKQVKCITTNKIFNSVKDAGNYYKVTPSNISSCCTGHLKTSGQLKDGTRLKWEYVT